MRDEESGSLDRSAFCCDRPSAATTADLPTRSSRTFVLDASPFAADQYKSYLMFVAKSAPYTGPGDEGSVAPILSRFFERIVSMIETLEEMRVP